MDELNKIIVKAVGPADIYTLSGAIPESTADLLVDNEFYSGLYWKGQDCFIFVVDNKEFSSSKL